MCSDLEMRHCLHLVARIDDVVDALRLFSEITAGITLLQAYPLRIVMKIYELNGLIVHNVYYICRGTVRVGKSIPDLSIPTVKSVPSVSRD